MGYKNNTGYLYPLERGFLYVPRPPLHIRFDEVAHVNFARGTGTLRSFDFEITTKNEQVRLVQYRILVFRLDVIKSLLNVQNINTSSLRAFRTTLSHYLYRKAGLLLRKHDLFCNPFSDEKQASVLKTAYVQFSGIN